MTLIFVCQLRSAECGSTRMVFGTDAPWFNYPYYIGSLLGADITDEDRRNICYRNAERLLKPLMV